jgi:hypothetical protein
MEMVRAAKELSFPVDCRKPGEIMRLPDRSQQGWASFASRDVYAVSQIGKDEKLEVSEISAKRLCGNLVELKGGVTRATATWTTELHPASIISRMTLEEKAIL